MFPPKASMHPAGPSTPGADFANPKADALNKKRKKIRMNPSMMGLKAATAPKPPMSEPPPGPSENF